MSQVFILIKEHLNLLLFILIVKVVIVGGGLAGSLSALNIDAETSIFEEHHSPGFPMSCAGLISEECYKKLIKLSRYCKKAKMNRIRGAFLFSPSGNYTEIIGRDKGIVVERKILDAQLLREASKKSEINMNAKVLEIRRDKILVRIDGKIKEFNFNFLIGADGVYSIVRKRMGFKSPSIYTAIQYLIEFHSLDSNMVELYFGKRYSDSFFAYAIPINDDFARIGVISKKNPEIYFRNLIKKHVSVSERVGKSIIEINNGAIPIGLIDFVRENVALIGDAAGMVKPYTGGGIYYSLIAAEILGDNFPNLKKFKTEYLKEMRREYIYGEKIRRLYTLLSDEEYEHLIKIVRDVDLSKVSMDSPSSILKIMPKVVRLLKNSKLFLKILNNFIFKNYI